MHTALCLRLYNALFQTGGGHVHDRRGDGDVGRFAGGGAWRGRVGAHQHVTHERAAAETALPAGRAVALEATGRYIRAREQVSSLCTLASVTLRLIIRRILGSR